MPLKPNPSKQLITFEDAKALKAKLAAKGIPVGPIREISDMYGDIPTELDNGQPNPDYYSDGTPYQFVATIWGKDAELGIVKNVYGDGGWDKTYALASMQFSTGVGPGQLTDLKVYPAILALNGVMSAVDTILR